MTKNTLVDELMDQIDDLENDLKNEAVKRRERIVTHITPMLGGDPGSIIDTATKLLNFIENGVKAQTAVNTVIKTAKKRGRPAGSAKKTGKRKYTKRSSYWKK